MRGGAHGCIIGRGAGRMERPRLKHLRVATQLTRLLLWLLLHGMVHLHYLHVEA